MPSIANLVPEIWLRIIERFDLGSLYLLSETFYTSRIHPFITAICTRQVQVRLRQFVTEGTVEVMVQITEMTDVSSTESICLVLLRLSKCEEDSWFGFHLPSHD